jgi:hypothetical protein
MNKVAQAEQRAARDGGDVAVGAITFHLVMVVVRCRA